MVSVGMMAITPDATPFASTRAIAGAGLDHVVCGDHVSFIVGAGFDGLIGATHELATAPSLRAFVAVYLLPLRHPVLVARQLSSSPSGTRAGSCSASVSAARIPTNSRSAASTRAPGDAAWTSRWTSCGRCSPAHP